MTNESNMVIESLIERNLSALDSELGFPVSLHDVIPNANEHRTASIMYGFIDDE